MNIVNSHSSTYHTADTANIYLDAYMHACLYVLYVFICVCVYVSVVCVLECMNGYAYIWVCMCIIGECLDKKKRDWHILIYVCDNMNSKFLNRSYMLFKNFH